MMILVWGRGRVVIGMMGNWMGGPVDKTVKTISIVTAGVKKLSLKYIELCNNGSKPMGHVHHLPA